MYSNLCITVLPDTNFLVFSMYSSIGTNSQFVTIWLFGIKDFNEQKDDFISLKIEQCYLLVSYYLVLAILDTP